jgi:lysophospholipase L1-like esterase
VDLSPRMIEHARRLHPADPQAMLPAYDSGDHLHPGDAGYRAMAEAVPLDAL